MFEIVSLHPNPQREECFALLPRAAEILKKAGKRLYLREEHRERFAALDGVEFVPDAVFYSSDLIISFGGDGTILSVSRQARVYRTPILGVNCGHVGFLTAFSSEDLSGLSDLSEDKVRIEDRMMLTVSHRGKKYHALNEACVVSKNSCAISEFDVTIDDNFIGHYFADGVIVATSTGSTAYSLSAGGAAVDPRLNCICITPICPHSLLRARPLIEPPTAKVCLSHISSAKSAAVLCIDGRREIDLGEDPVEIRKSRQVTRLVLPREQNFCNVLYSKFFERN